MNSNFSTFTIKLQSNRFQKQIVNRLCGGPVVYRSIVYIDLPVRKAMAVIQRLFPRNLGRLKNIKKTELQEKFSMVTGLCTSREESQTQKFGIDHLRWEGGLTTENRFKADVWSNGWKPIVVILIKFKHLVVTILWETTCNQLIQQKSYLTN